MSDKKENKNHTVRYSKPAYRALVRSSQDRDLEPLSDKGKGSGTFQALVEHAIELFLAVSAERHAAGDVDRLKEYARFLALPQTEGHKKVAEIIELALNPVLPTEQARTQSK